MTVQVAFGRRPIVVVAQWRRGEGRLPLPYVEAVRAVGGRVRIASAFRLPPEEIPAGVEIVDHVDPDDVSSLDDAIGLVLPGGGDIDPSWYGRPRHPRTYAVNHLRDRFELALMTAALERDMPILAICHGMQLLNVHLGGTLDQHLSDNPVRMEHDRGNPSPNPIHRLRIKERSALARVLGTTEAQINSHHHQGIADVAHGLEEVGWSEDGVLESVVSSSHTWVVGVQWHPEVMVETSESQRNLFGGLVAAGAEYQAGERAAKASA
jgi:putative glutamine amidotransferase